MPDKTSDDTRSLRDEIKRLRKSLADLPSPDLLEARV
jgi:hypothetical protein